MPIPAADLVRLTPQQVLDAELPDWRFVFTSIDAVFTTPSYDAGLALVAAVGEAAQAADHHPDLELRYGTVHVRLTSHDVRAVTERDVRLARRISALASEHGAVARPERVQALELALDSADHARILPFWAALLGLDPAVGKADEIVDPDGRLPLVWFQGTEASSQVEPPRQRWHLDVRVPPEELEGRLAACLAAGGELVDDAAAPAFWVLADAEGNRACLTTWQGRD